MGREVFVYVDTDGSPRLAGRLWARSRKGRDTASFEYDRSWLEHPEHFSLEPALEVGPGAFHSDSALFGALGDSAPDRWGRVLMQRAERRRARRADATPRTLSEIDYVLGVNDEARQGALRFSLDEGAPFLATSENHPIPPLISLPGLLSAAERVVGSEERDEDLRLLLAPGSSLGGARPKASVRDRDGQLAIAKFPHRDDEWNTVRWEAVALTLAEKAGIDTPRWRLEEVAGQAVLLLHRFDRERGNRVPFLSALSMLGAGDREAHSYLEFVDALRQHGAALTEDACQLWRRIVFSILISNTDDHLRNHGFLYAGPDGWRLAPAYDLNPVPVDIKPRVLTTTIDYDDGTASLDLATHVAEHFLLSEKNAKTIAGEVGRAVSTWRDTAAALGASRVETDRMASAFENDDLRAACA